MSDSMFGLQQDEVSGPNLKGNFGQMSGAVMAKRSSNNQSQIMHIQQN